MPFRHSSKSANQSDESVYYPFVCSYLDVLMCGAKKNPSPAKDKEIAQHTQYFSLQLN
jgi:hypothetical protein